MFAVIVGGGKVGSFIAETLQAKNHRVTVVEQRPEAAERLKKESSLNVVEGDGCEPYILEKAQTAKADVVVAATGHDEDNLVVCLLSKLEYEVPLTIGRINNPRNAWLFDKKRRVDVAVSSPHIIASLLEEEVSLGDVIGLLKLRKGEVSLIEAVLTERSNIVKKTVGELCLPPDCVIAAIIRGKQVLIPQKETQLEVGDEILAVSTLENEAEIKKLLGQAKNG